MSYKISPKPEEVVLTELTNEEVRKLKNRVLASNETNGFGVLQYGRIVELSPATEYTSLVVGQVVLFEDLHAHKTDFGDPRQLIVPIEAIHGTLVEDK